jgi:[acyl-carrier-protein] S-malonyltransferase
MQPARERLRADLAQVELRTPRFPVYSNVLAQPEVRPSVIRELLLEQVTHAVRWVEILQQLRKQGVKTYLEFGVGRVLTGLVGRTLEGVEARSLTNPREIAESLVALGKN